MTHADNIDGYTAADLVLCQSGDGWSFHPPGSTDDDIAEGDAPYLLTGAGRPTTADRRAAFDAFLARR